MRALLLAAVTLALTTTVSMAQKASTATTASIQPTPSGRHLSTEEADALVHRGGGGVAPAPSNRVRCYDRQRRAGANACQAAVRCNLDYAYSGALCI